MHRGDQGALGTAGRGRYAHQVAKMATATVAPSQWRPRRTKRRLGMPARAARMRTGISGRADDSGGEPSAGHPGERADQPSPTLEEAVGEDQGQQQREHRDGNDLHRCHAPEDRRVHAPILSGLGAWRRRSSTRLTLRAPRRRRQRCARPPCRACACRATPSSHGRRAPCRGRRRPHPCPSG